jgi:hypothetical protein
MEQLRLPFGNDRSHVSSLLAKLTGREVHLTITQNRRVFLSYRKEGDLLKLRLHEVFLSADDKVLKSVADFVNNKRDAIKTLRAFVRVHRDTGYPSKRKVPLRSPQGKVYNLQDIFNELNRRYFHSRLKSEVIWGNAYKKGRVMKRILGSYHRQSGIIVINPILDSKRVPLYYLAFVVYHEMLHADIGVVDFGGRRIVHSRKFRARERAFHDYQRAIKWERENL